MQEYLALEPGTHLQVQSFELGSIDLQAVDVIGSPQAQVSAVWQLELVAPSVVQTQAPQLV